MAEWEAWSQEIEEIRELGDKVMVVSTQRGRARTTGIDVSARFATLYEVRSRELSRVTLYGTEGEALEAAGISE